MSEKELVEFEKVIQGVLSHENQIRKTAETIFQKCATNGEKFFGYSSQLLSVSKDEQVRTFCAVMIRQYLGLNNDLWSHVSGTVKERVKGIFLELFKKEENRSIRKKVSNVIGALAAKAFSKEEKWDALLPTLLEVWKSSPHPLHRESVLDVFDVLAEFCIELLRPGFKQLTAILSQGLTDKTDNVRIAALRATVSLVVSVNDKERAKLAECVPAMFQTIVSVFKNENEDALQEGLEILTNVVRCQPTYLRSNLKNCVGAVAQILDSKMEPDTKRVAMEFLISLAENGKGMVRKLPEYSATVIPAAFTFMLDIEHTKEWDTGEDEDDSEQTNYLMGVDSIERLSITLGPKVFLKIADPILDKFLAGEWQNRHAALMGIAKMATGCEKQMKRDLEKLIKAIISLMKTEKHPRVQWAAINALAQLSVDFAPDVQKKHHELVLPAIGVAINPSLNPRVVRHATLSIVDFCNGAESDGVLPHIGPLLTVLTKLLNSTNLKIQEASLSAVTAVALVIDKEFTKYYSSFIGGIKNILINARDEKHRELRGKAMECVGVIAKVVGKDVFGTDFVTIVKILLETQKEGLKGDDPQYSHLVQALARICQCMGQAFVPYLKFTIPPLLKSASISDACVMDDGIEGSDLSSKEGYETVNVAIRHVGTKRITMNTSLLEEQATACTVLSEYAHELKEGFFPYVKDTAAALIPLCTYAYNEKVRVAAVQTLPSLVEATVLHLQKNGGDKTLVAKLWEEMFPQYIKAFAKETHLDNLTLIVDSFTDSVKALGGPLSEKHATVLTQVLKELVEASVERRQQRDEVRKSEDFDDQESHVIEEENEEEDRFLSNVYYLVAALVKSLKNNFIPLFHKHLFGLFWPMLAQEKSVGEHIAAICIFDDLICYGGLPGMQYLKNFLPIILGYCKDKDPDVRQSAAWGVGACAQVAGDNFLPVVDVAIDTLLKVIGSQDAKTDDNEPATENAIGAIGKICKHTLSIKGQEEKQKKILPLWINWLPIKCDYEEGQVVHDILCDFIESSNPFLQMDKNLPKVLSIFANIVGTNRVTEATTARILKIWKKMGALPSTIMQAAVSRLPQEEQTKLKQIATLASSSGSTSP